MKNKFSFFSVIKLWKLNIQKKVKLFSEPKESKKIKEFLETETIGRCKPFGAT